MGTKLPAKVSFETGPADGPAEDCALKALDTREGNDRGNMFWRNRSVDCWIWGAWCIYLIRKMGACSRCVRVRAGVSSLSRVRLLTLPWLLPLNRTCFEHGSSFISLDQLILVSWAYFFFAVSKLTLNLSSNNVCASNLATVDYLITHILIMHNSHNA